MNRILLALKRPLSGCTDSATAAVTGVHSAFLQPDNARYL